MERLKQRLAIAERAARSLRELVESSTSSLVERDAAIQRFEYTFEAVWKAAQRFLLVVEGRTEGSPKSCIRAARETGLLTEAIAERALLMADDRNLTVHTYNESLAETIRRRLPDHLAVLTEWLAAMNRKIPS